MFEYIVWLYLKSNKIISTCINAKNDIELCNSIFEKKFFIVVTKNNKKIRKFKAIKITEIAYIEAILKI